MIQEIEDKILTLTAARGSSKTICPSEVARALSDEWRPLMPLVRQVAGSLAEKGKIIATQKGQQVDPQLAIGPIRLGLPVQAHF
ncbi:MAG: DUF3253 domain-containing protein [Pseudomonadota bacterium]